MSVGRLPTVGIVIASYNCARFITQTIESAARQTYQNIEVVVVDDASTDDTSIVIQSTLGRLNDRRFRYVRLKENRGQAGAIRAGLEQLETAFVCFLDGDDVWRENFVERHVSAHLNTEFPVGISYCDSCFINGNGELLAGTAWWFQRSPDDNALTRALESSCLPTIDCKANEISFPENLTATIYHEWSSDWSSNSTTSMMFRRALVDLVFRAEDNELRLYVDFYLSTFCVLVAGGVALHEALYAYRMHGLNLHSDGAVLGGPFQTSRKPWGPIRDRILILILSVLQKNETEFVDAIGASRYEHVCELLERATFVPVIVEVEQTWAAKMRQWMFGRPPS